MRRPWIKIETATPDKPEICAIATSLRMDPDAVLGKLVRLWSWVEVNRVSANDLGVTREFIDKLVGRKGFASALVACGWLTDVGERLGLPNLDRHNGGSAKIRALTAQRVALHRQRKHMASRSGVSEALHADVTLNEAALESNDAKTVLTNDKPLIHEREVKIDELSEVGTKDVTSVEGGAVVHSPDSLAVGELAADEFLAGDVPRFEEAGSAVSTKSSAETSTTVSVESAVVNHGQEVCLGESAEPSAPASVEPPLHEVAQESSPVGSPTAGIPVAPTEQPSEAPPSRKRRSRPTSEPSSPDQPLLF